MWVSICSRFFEKIYLCTYVYRFALIVVDSATNLYRTDYTGRGELSERYLFHTVPYHTVL